MYVSILIQIKIIYIKNKQLVDQILWQVYIITKFYNL